MEQLRGGRTNMIRRILIWVRNFIDKILWKTAKHPTYTVSWNEITPSANCSETVTFYPTATNTVIDCVASNANGIWLYGSTDGNQT